MSSRLFAKMIGLAATLCLLSACSGGGNVRPGDPDYPVPNPKSQASARIQLSLPPELEVSLAALWSADYKNSACRYYENGLLRFEGAPFPFRLVQTLPVLRDGEQLSVPVVLDQYAPGRCDWKLTSIKMWVSDRKTPPQEVDIYTINHQASSSSKAHLWCRKARRVGDAEDRVFCGYYNTALPPGIRQDSPSSLALGPDQRAAELIVHFAP